MCAWRILWQVRKTLIKILRTDARKNGIRFHAVSETFIHSIQTLSEAYELYWIAGWVVPRACLVVLEKGKIYSPPEIRTPEHCARSLVAIKTAQTGSVRALWLNMCRIKLPLPTRLYGVVLDWEQACVLCFSKSNKFGESIWKEWKESSLTQCRD